uniref:Transmembrane protein n=1 Tax=Pithovirus LCPAC202 TaxID=2506592 RepID=A0A481Z6B3_9VIRU|nr:MAG: hypothetical protein LCPAC202_01200 [Pithovirus LCPAC202]
MSNSSLQSLIIDDKNLPEDEEDNCPLHYTARKKKKQTYPPTCVRKVQLVYIIAAIVWIIIVFVLCFWEIDIIGIVILAFPLVIFGVNFANTTVLTHDIESEMFTGNFISFGFLIAIILINWSKIGDKSKYFTILFISLILIMLSLVDVWVDSENLSVAKHIRSIFQTTALSLLVYALYVYYKDVMRTPTTTETENKTNSSKFKF